MPGKMFRVALLAFVLMLAHTTINAENIENLYDARISVLKQHEKPEEQELYQRQLIAQAFTQVLYKVTGSREFLAIGDSKKLLANAEKLVQKYAYETVNPNKDQEKVDLENRIQPGKPNVPNPQTPERTNRSNDDVYKPDDENPNPTSLNPIIANDAALEKTDTAQGTSEAKKTPSAPQQEVLEQDKEKVFFVRFNPEGTNQLLKEFGLPVWDSLRPDTLVWLSIEENRQRNILTPATSKQPFDVIQKQANVRGIPIKIPFGDLEDKNRLTIADLWGNFSDAILAASQRYHTQAVLAVRVFQEPSGLWIGNWSLYILGENANWQIKNEYLDVVLKQGIDRLGDNLAARFAVQIADNNQNKLLVQINNVVNFDGFLRVKNYLDKLPAIKSNTLLATYGDSLLYELEYLSSENHLLQTLNLGNILQKVENSRVENQSEQLEYTPVLLDESESPQKTTGPNSAAQKPSIANQSTTNQPITKNEPPSSDTKVNDRADRSEGLAKNGQDINNKEVTEQQNTNLKDEEVVKVPLPTPTVEYWLVN